MAVSASARIDGQPEDTGDPARAFESMCAAVRGLGYQAAVEEADESGAVITTPTCPLRPLVYAHPEAAEIDRGMWVGLAAHALRDADVASVSCETRDCFATTPRAAWSSRFALNLSFWYIEVVVCPSEEDVQWTGLH